MRDRVKPILQSRRSRFCLGCSAALIVIAVSTIIVLHTLMARQWIVGPADPKTGMRIRYSISPGYENKPIPDEVIGDVRSVADRFRYWPPEPPRYIQWLEDHRVHIPGRQSGGDGLTFVASVRPVMEGWGVDKDGFVNIDVRGAALAGISRVVSQEKRLVNGCPTTLIVEDTDIDVDGHPCQKIDLVLRSRGGSMAYLFEADGVEGEKDNPDVRELSSIRDSIQVVRH